MSNSLVELNNYSNDIVNYSDFREPVIFAIDVPENQSVEIDENDAHLFPLGLTILEINDPVKTQVTLTINLSSLPGTSSVEVMADPMPPSVVVTELSTNVFRISGIINLTVWNAIKDNIVVQVPFGVSGARNYTASIQYLDDTLTPVILGWNVAVNIIPQQKLTVPDPFVFYVQTTEVIPTSTIIVNTGTFDPIWTMRIIPSVIGVFSAVTVPANTAALTFNTTSDQITLVGNKTQVNAALNDLEITFGNVSSNFSLLYLLTNSINSQSSSQSQSVRSLDFIILKGFDADLQAEADKIRTTSAGLSSAFTASATAGIIFNSDADLGANAQMITNGGKLLESSADLNSEFAQSAEGGPSYKLTTVSNLLCEGINLKYNLWSWGSNFYGATGQGTTSGFSSTPIDTNTGTEWIQIDTGREHSLGIKNDGTLWAWGNNANGRTGLGISNGITTIPTQVGTDTDWSKIAAGFTKSYAIKTNGRLYIFGSFTNILTPTVVGTDQWKEIIVQKNTDQVQIGIKNNGTLWAWGINTNGLAAGSTINSGQVGTNTDWSTIGIGQRQAFAIKNNGTMWAWGTDATADGSQTYGNLGLGFISDPVNTYIFPPQQIGSDSDWVSVSSNWLSSFAIKNNGTLWAWGDNTAGLLGISPSGTNRISPIRVGSLSGFTQVSAGYLGISLAIRTTGTIGSGSLAGTIYNWPTSSADPVPKQIGTAQVDSWKMAAAGNEVRLALRGKPQQSFFQ